MTSNAQSPIHLRSLQQADAARLLELFKDTVRRINARDYSTEQIAAWASPQIDLAAWSERFVGRYVRLAVCAGQVVGFADMEANGHIDRFYVSADFQGRGAGRLLLNNLIDEAKRQRIDRLFTEASITARPFFERRGFVVEQAQTVVVRGMEFLNYRMSRKVLDEATNEAAPV